MNKSLIPWKKRHSSMATRQESGDPFVELHRQMNDLFESFFDDFGGSWLPSRRRGGDLLDDRLPRFEVAETDKAVEVTAEFPGMDEKDLHVTVDEGRLTVGGEKKEEHEEKNKTVHFSERSYGSFHRSIPLPPGIDLEHIEARFKKGVLRISLPKNPEATDQRKHIAIQAE